METFSNLRCRTVVVRRMSYIDRVHQHALGMSAHANRATPMLYRRSHMEPITRGMQGPAVEDVQTRLSALGYTIEQGELEAHDFGASTAMAVSMFRMSNGLMPARASTRRAGARL